MMKHEFESLVGHEVSQEEYEKIEFCYMYSDFFVPEKKDVADLYKLLGSDLFNRLYLELDDYVRIIGVWDDMCGCLFEENRILRRRISELDSLSRDRDEEIFRLESRIKELELFISDTVFVLSNNMESIKNQSRALLGGQKER